MEVGCSSITFGMLPLEAALDEIAGLGFTTVEIGSVGQFCPHLDPTKDLDESAQAVRAALDARGLALSAINSVPFLYAKSSTDAEELLGLTDRLLQLAQRLGTSLIVDAGRRTDDREQALKQSADLLGMTFRRARDVYGVTLSVEAPHLGMTAQDVVEAAQLLELVGEPDLGITYDTSHALSGGYTAQQGLDLLADRIVRVQARDSLDGDIHHTPGEGDYEWDVLLNHLRDTGFPGPVVLELEYGGRLDVPAVRAAAVQARAFLLGRHEALVGTA